MAERVRVVEVISELPLNASGKVEKGVLRAWSAGTPGSGRP